MNKFLLNIFTFCFFAFLSESCQVENQELLSTQEYNCEPLQEGSVLDYWEKSVPYGIDSIYLQEDCIGFDLAFSGGCEEHTFDLRWEGKIGRYVFIDRSDASLFEGDIDSIEVYNADNYERIPVIVLYLIHNDNEDFCEAQIRESLSFDISKVQQDEHTEVRLEVHSTAGVYNYQYSFL